MQMNWLDVNGRINLDFLLVKLFLNKNGYCAPFEFPTHPDPTSPLSFCLSLEFTQIYRKCIYFREIFLQRLKNPECLIRINR
ncbi:MAG: hypothetical protein FD188_3578 [Ignavibacteria bacterium]|nr:MAG: hypothetical protein FD188_3578 [Ignavibacteria bacterium]